MSIRLTAYFGRCDACGRSKPTKPFHAIQSIAICVSLLVFRHSHNNRGNVASQSLSDQKTCNVVITNSTVHPPGAKRSRQSSAGAPCIGNLCNSVRALRTSHTEVEAGGLTNSRLNRQHRGSSRTCTKVQGLTWISCCGSGSNVSPQPFVNIPWRLPEGWVCKLSMSEMSVAVLMSVGHAQAFCNMTSSTFVELALHSFCSRANTSLACFFATLCQGCSSWRFHLADLRHG